MAYISKRQKTFITVDKNKLYPIDEAIGMVKKSATAKFDESIDVSINLNIDTKKTEASVRGAIVLPHGTGRSARVAVFTQGANVDLAKGAGADVVGMEDLAEDIKKGNIKFDVVIASPDAMKVVGTLGQVLGPRGLMPNPKVGTVTTDVAQAVKNAKAGQVQYRADKSGIVHATIGRASFSLENIKENFLAFLDAVVKAKPSISKGQYLKGMSISSTMGIGVRIDQSTIKDSK